MRWALHRFSRRIKISDFESPASFYSSLPIRFTLFHFTHLQKAHKNMHVSLVHTVPFHGRLLTFWVSFSYINKTTLQETLSCSSHPILASVAMEKRGVLIFKSAIHVTYRARPLSSATRSSLTHSKAYQSSRVHQFNKSITHQSGWISYSDRKST